MAVWKRNEQIKLQALQQVIYFSATQVFHDDNNQVVGLTTIYLILNFKFSYATPTNPFLSSYNQIFYRVRHICKQTNFQN